MDGQASRIIESEQVDALFVTSPANMRALSGFTGEGYVYVSADRHMVVTDFRYVIAAKKECLGWDIIDMKGKYYEPLIDAICKDNIHLLGYEYEHVTMHQFNQICNLYQEFSKTSLEFQNVDEAIRKSRMIKNEREIEYITKAEAIGDLAFEKILPFIGPDITEKQIAAKLDYFMKEAGAEDVSFQTIVASGMNSAMPHAVPTQKKLAKGDFITMDFGCKYHGYCSDMTRTVVLGKANDRQKEIYQLVLDAQLAALSQIQPGMTGQQVDAIARDIIVKAGHGDEFGHGLGHSVGLEIHENPSFSRRDERVIEPGMVITVEPGVYIEGFGGVRIEDLVCITEDGCHNLTHSPKNLIEII